MIIENPMFYGFEAAMQLLTVRELNMLTYIDYETFEAKHTVYFADRSAVAGISEMLLSQNDIMTNDLSIVWEGVGDDQNPMMARCKIAFYGLRDYTVTLAYPEIQRFAYHLAKLEKTM